jgi:hypothetical protein
VVDDVVEDRSVEDGGGVELFAGEGRADDGENAGADDGSYAKRGQGKRTEGFPELVLGFFRLGDELVDRLAAKGLAWQSPAPILSWMCDEGSLPRNPPSRRGQQSPALSATKTMPHLSTGRLD